MAKQINTLEVAKRVVNDLRITSDYINEQGRKITTITNDLHSYWNDTQYDQFSNYIEDLTRTLKQEAAKIRSVAENIQRDEISSIMNQ